MSVLLLTTEVCYRKLRVTGSLAQGLCAVIFLPLGQALVGVTRWPDHTRYPQCLLGLTRLQNVHSYSYYGSISFILSDTNQYHDTHELICDTCQRYILSCFRPNNVISPHISWDFGNIIDQNTLNWKKKIIGWSII